MASLKLGEVIVDAAVAKLKNGMAGRVAEINQQINDGITITAPRTSSGPSLDSSDFYKSGIEAVPPGPAVIVVEGPTTITPDTEGPHSFITETEIGVWLLEQDPNRERLGKKLQRQARAALETLWDDPPQEALTGSAYRISLVRTQPGRVFEPDQDDIWRAFYLIVMLAEQLEG